MQRLPPMLTTGAVMALVGLVALLFGLLGVRDAIQANDSAELLRFALLSLASLSVTSLGAIVFHRSWNRMAE